MRFNVAQLLRQSTGATRHFHIDEPSGIEDPNLAVVGPIRGSVDLLRTQRGILVTGDLTQVVRIQCVRCLTDMEVPLYIHLEEEFFPTIDLKSGNHIAWDAEESEEIDESVMIDERHTLDLREVVRQELLLELPSHPICQPDCRGICPICGIDRNVETCECTTDTTDPRWAVLEQLKRTTDKDQGTEDSS